MRVLLVCIYPPDRRKGSMLFARVLQRELPGCGVGVDVISPRQVFNLFRGRHPLGQYLAYLDKMLVFPLDLRRKLKERFDYHVHICDYANAGYTRFLRRVPHVVTCHDVIDLRASLGEIPGTGLDWHQRQWQKLHRSGLDRAQMIVCVSKATRDDVLRLSRIDPKRVKVIYSGLNYPYSPMPPADSQRLLERFKLPPRYLLHVGDDLWYKNRTGVVQIHDRLKARMPDAPALVMAGAPAVPGSENAENRRDLVVIPECTQEELRGLYSRAEALLFPSLLEGLGWPLLEAQACGCPVITSNQPPMNEIGGEGAVYLDPTQLEDAAEIVRRMLLEEPALRAERIQQGLAHAARFSSENMVEDYVMLYRRL